MSRRLPLTVVERGGSKRAMDLTLDTVINLGSATRSDEVAKLHRDEVLLHGVHVATEVPAPRMYPIAASSVVTDDLIEVQTEETSGEVEIVLILADQLYVGVGSDHTDRALERASIPWSKQACANVLAPQVWPFEELKDDWDSCVLRSWVDGRLYQEVGVDAFLRPETVLEIVAERAPGFPETNAAIFCGTIVSVDKRLGFGSRWAFEMTDPKGDRCIRHTYDVRNMFDAIRPDYRVPMLTGAIGPDLAKSA